MMVCFVAVLQERKDNIEAFNIMAAKHFIKLNIL